MSALLLTLVMAAPPPVEMYQTQTWQQIYVQSEEPIYEDVTETWGTCFCEMCLRLGWSGTKTVGQVRINGRTPFEEIEKIFRAVQLKASDRVCDAGSGDGRVVILAAKEFGSKGVGLDNREAAIALSEANARRSAVDNLVKFKPWDVLEVDYSLVSVVYAHLPPGVTKRLGRRLGDYRQNIRVAVSYAHRWGVSGEEQVGKFWVWRPKRRSRRGSSDPASIMYDYKAPQADQNSTTTREERSDPQPELVVRAWGASWCSSCKSERWQKLLDRVAALPGVTVKRMSFDDHQSYCFENGITTLPSLQIMDSDESEQKAVQPGPVDFETVKAILEGRKPEARQTSARATGYGGGYGYRQPGS